jgi:hypothetical protein
MMIIMKYVNYSPSLSGNPAVTKVTNAASPRSLALANASSIRPLWPRCMDSTALMFLLILFLVCCNLVAFVIARELFITVVEFEVEQLADVANVDVAVVKRDGRKAVVLVISGEPLRFSSECVKRAITFVLVLNGDAFINCVK